MALFIFTSQQHGASQLKNIITFRDPLSLKSLDADFKVACSNILTYLVISLYPFYVR